MLRVIGVVMLFSFFTGGGFLFSEHFSARVRKLSQADRLLTDMIGMVQNQNLPTDEILFRLWQEGYLVDQISSAAEAMRSFAEDPLFRKEERVILLRAGELLGTLDRESQCARLSLERKSLQKYVEDAVQEKETRGKLCRSAGVLLGILVSVLAI